MTCGLGAAQFSRDLCAAHPSPTCSQPRDPAPERTKKPGIFPDVGDSSHRRTQRVCGCQGRLDREETAQLPQPPLPGCRVGVSLSHRATTSSSAQPRKRDGVTWAPCDRSLQLASSHLPGSRGVDGPPPGDPSEALSAGPFRWSQWAQSRAQVTSPLPSPLPPSLLGRPRRPSRVNCLHPSPGPRGCVWRNPRLDENPPDVAARAHNPSCWGLRERVQRPSCQGWAACGSPQTVLVCRPPADRPGLTSVPCR